MSFLCAPVGVSLLGGTEKNTNINIHCQSFMGHTA